MMEVRPTPSWRSIRSIGEGSRRMAVGRGHEDKEDLQEQNGRVAEDQSLAGRLAPRPEKRYHPREPATGRSDGRSAGDD